MTKPVINFRNRKRPNSLSKNVGVASMKRIKKKKSNIRKKGKK